MSAPVIRASTLADAFAVDRLLGRSYPVLLKPDYAPSVLVAAVPAMSRARPELLSSGTYFLAEHEGVVVAAGGWTEQSPHGQVVPQLGHVRHVAVDPNVVRQGVGRAVMVHVLASARSSGITAMECWSTRTAVPFYEAMGFVRKADMVVPIGPAKIAFQAVQMFAELD